MVSTETVLDSGAGQTMVEIMKNRPKASTKTRNNKWANALASLCDDSPEPAAPAKLNSPISFRSKTKKTLVNSNNEKTLLNETCLELPTALPNKKSQDVEDEGSSVPTSSNSSTPTTGSFEDSASSIESEEDTQALKIKSSLALDEPETLVLSPEWIGTSQFQIDFACQLQERGELLDYITMRKRLSDCLEVTPYDPVLYIDLAGVDNELGFCDIAAANAHKALTLVKCGLSDSRILYPNIPDLKDNVRTTLGKRTLRASEILIDDELDHLRLQAYRALLKALVGCAAFHEALFVVAKEALKLYPRDYAPDGLDYSRMIAKGRYKERLAALTGMDCPVATLSEILKKGKIQQKKYPWLNEELNWRSEEMVRNVNEELGEGCSCEVRPVVFDKQGGDTKLSAIAASTEKGDPATSSVKKDVGPLGIFAKRDIKEDEIVLIDTTLLNSSNAPSSELQYCDACNSCLNPPYLHPSEVVWASCCDRVAFCSTTCRDTAVKGYHTVLCGKDLDWLYEGVKNVNNITKEGVAQAWRPISFARLVSVVIADWKVDDVHPLKHRLLARMAANYAPPEQIEPGQLYDFGYQENVVAPMEILLALGVDVFKRRDWDPEVIQTAYWRMDNNANMGRTSVYPEGEPLPHPTQLPTPPSSLSSKTSLRNPALTNPRTIRPILNTININPIYLFFNHSCIPSIFWHSALPSPDVDLKWLENGKGGMLRPGNSAVSCKAIRNIKAGEELTITYVGDPLGKDGGPNNEGRKGTRIALDKWFPGGCGCRICERENAEEEKSVLVQRSAQWESRGVEGDIDI